MHAYFYRLCKKYLMEVANLNTYAALTHTHKSVTKTTRNQNRNPLKLLSATLTLASVTKQVDLLAKIRKADYRHRPEAVEVQPYLNILVAMVRQSKYDKA